MGTRADYYIGRGPKAVWIGSTAFDGYPGSLPGDLLNATTEDDFKGVLTDMAKEREDFTVPEQGWPWPWENSGTTDYAYAFDEGKVWMSRYGRVWARADQPEPDRDTEDENAWPKGNPAELFPDMTELMNVTWGKRSGLIVFKSA